MSNEAIGALKLRVAKGEISVEEYERLKRVVSDEPLAGEQLAHSSQEFKNISLQVGNDFRVSEGQVFYKSQKRPVSSIKGIEYSASRDTTVVGIVGWSKNKDGMHITFDDESFIALQDVKYFITGKVAKQIQEAYSILAAQTFNMRLRKITEDVERDGEVAIGIHVVGKPLTINKVFLTANGVLTDHNGFEVSLPAIAQTGTITLGERYLTSWMSSAYSPNNATLYKGTSRKKGDGFDFTFYLLNKDVALSLLHSWFNPC